MKDTELIQMGLGLTHPWEVVSCEFSQSQRRLDIHIDFPRGSLFNCPACGQKGCRAYDTEQKTWRHLNFFEHETYLKARVPRISCPSCGIKKVDVPWARRGSGFTLLFEAWIMAAARSMPVEAVAKLVNEHDTRLWRIINYHTEETVSRKDISGVSCIGVDETAVRRAHNYITIFVDIDKSETIFVTPGKGSETIKKFSRKLAEYGGNPNNIKKVSCDMSPAFISGIEKYLPKADITFDRFHLMKIFGDAVNKVRRQEAQQYSELKKTRWIWLKNINKLTAKEKEQIEIIKNKYPRSKTVRAWQARLDFQKLYSLPLKDSEKYLKKWYFKATHSRIEPVKNAAYSIKRHWDGVLNWFKSHISNGILEGTNSLVQSAKSRARGFRSDRYFQNIIFLITGKLEFGLPT